VTVIVASDSTGLLYALYSFMQLLQLHSEVHTAPAVASDTPQADVITTGLTIFSHFFIISAINYIVIKNS